MEEYTRNCLGCDKVLTYVTFGGYQKAEALNACCKSCAAKQRAAARKNKNIPVEINTYPESFDQQLGKWFKPCMFCKQNIFYKTLSGFIVGKHRDSICRKCTGETFSKVTVQKRIDNKIINQLKRQEGLTNKYCNNCNLTKDIIYFVIDKTRKDGYRDRCLDCAILLKKCTKCGSSGPFTKDKHTRDGLNTKCNSCAQEACKEYHSKNWVTKRAEKRKIYNKENRSRIAARNMFFKYGLTQEEFDTKLNSQNGNCKICQTQLVTRGKSILRACIDHCHKTGTIRGILCQQCNKGIGHFYDDPNIMRSAVDYLEKNLVIS